MVSFTLRLESPPDKPHEAGKSILYGLPPFHVLYWYTTLMVHVGEIVGLLMCTPWNLWGPPSPAWMEGTATNSTRPAPETGPQGFSLAARYCLTVEMPRPLVLGLLGRPPVSTLPPRSQSLRCYATWQGEPFPLQCPTP